MENTKTKLGRRIRELRESKGLKQCELAEKLNMEPSNLTRIENGKQLPKIENILKIASQLDVPEYDLFDFGHFTKKNELRRFIDNYLNTADLKDIEFAYKFFKGLSSYKNRKSSS